MTIPLPLSDLSGSINTMYTIPHILMCRPSYYTIAYEINPWMDINNPSDPVKSNLQWESLYNVIRRLGAEISLIEPVERLPDMVFTANAGLVNRDKVILGHFRHRERQGEERHYEKWFSDHGYNCHTLPVDLSFEGEGDTVFYKDITLLGYGFRTDIKSHPHIGEITGREYKSLKLIDPHFYHLDTCLLYIGQIDLIIYYPEAFHPESIEQIEGLQSNKLKIYREDAWSFVCNSVCIGTNLLFYKCSDILAREFKGYGLNIIPVDISEFMKSGGSIRCMVLRLS